MGVKLNDHTLEGHLICIHTQITIEAVYPIKKICYASNIRYLFCPTWSGIFGYLQIIYQIDIHKSTTDKHVNIAERLN